MRVVDLKIREGNRKRTTLEELGMAKNDARRVDEFTKKANGLVLVV